jgi:3-oxosteroid 1-dehydrogenase
MKTGTGAVYDDPMAHAGKRSVVIVGSGAAGLAAALGAAISGARVTVCESAHAIGGTTALSAGAAWLPANHLMTAAGIQDHWELAVEYVLGLGGGDVDEQLLRTFAADSSRVGERIEELTPVRWQIQSHPDYFVERHGARSLGRTLEPQPLVLAEDAAFIDDLVLVGAPGDLGTLPYAFGDVLDSYQTPSPQSAAAGKTIAMGRGLIAGLTSGALAHSVDIRTRCRIDALLTEDGSVVGARADDGTRLPGRVILATGGFERDLSSVRSFLRGPMLAPLGGAGARGDGLRMAMSVGAALGNMSEAWWCPAYRIPGERTWCGSDERFRILFPSHRALPGSILVDSAGRRFVDEAQNYNDVTRVMHMFRAGTFDFPAVPAWLIFDTTYRERYGGFLDVTADVPWYETAPTIPDLATRIGIDPVQVLNTVERFNSQAVEGRDTDYHRGTYAYDRYHGDSQAADPTLRPLTDAPYFALKVLPGAIGTKGGPRTDSCGRVLRAADRTVIAGLYAAGNVAASAFGMCYPGGGATIGPALVFGMRAGEAAALD